MHSPPHDQVSRCLTKVGCPWVKVRKSCDRIFGMIFAVTPEFQGKGVESGMIQYVYETRIGRAHV